MALGFIRGLMAESTKVIGSKDGSMGWALI